MPAPGAGAGGLRGATFSAFAFTSPPTIQLLVYLGISTLAAPSDLTFRIALYVLLKLAVVPNLYTVTLKSSERAARWTIIAILAFL
jgi:hypothetical protein